MNVQQFCLILLARWRILVGVMVLSLLAVVAWLVVAPNRFTATSQVLIDVRAPATVSVAGDSGMSPQLQPDYLSTQVDIIRSPRVAELAVQRLGILRNPEAMNAFRESGSTADPASYFASKLASGIRVVPSESSRVITILYSASNAETSAAVANAFTDAYREVSIDLQREPARQAERSYTQNVAQTAARLADAQTALSAKRAQYGITATGADGTDAEDARLMALSQQLATAQASQAVQNQRGGGGALPDQLLSPVVQQLQGEIAKVEAQRQQLATFAGPNNVDYKQLTNQLASLRGELGRQRALVASGAAASSAQASAAARQMQGAVSSQRQRVMANQRNRGDIAALEANVTSLKSTYDGLAAKQSQSKLLSLTDQSNVVILARADVPTSPTGLPWTLKLVAGIILGLLVGVVTAVIVELLDQRLRRPEDVTTWLGIADLGHVRMPQSLPGKSKLLGSTTRYLPRSDGWSEA